MPNFPRRWTAVLLAAGVLAVSAVSPVRFAIAPFSRRPNQHVISPRALHRLAFLRSAAINPLLFVHSANLPASPIPSGYQLIFDDEFASLSISDQDGTGWRWYSQTIQCCMQDTSAPSTPTHMAGITAPVGQNPFSLIPGQGLDIRLQKTNGAWYSGVLATVDRNGKGFSQQYGYFEMMAKFPSSSGTWPAFWLLNSATLANHVPAGEVDVVEAFMFAPDYINTTLHDWTPPARTLDDHLAHVSNLSQGFHTFGLLWTASTMKFFCDGTEIYSVPTPPIMNQPYYPIIDLGLGGGWPTANTPTRSDMIVRYVRVYAPPR